MIDTKEVLDLLNSSGVVIVVWSTRPNESALYISDNVSQFGYSPEDFYSGEFTDYWQFVHEDDRERAKKDIYDARRNVDASRHVCSLTYRVRCKTGEIRYVEETLIHESNDGELSEKGFIRDITASTDLVQSLRIIAEKYNYLAECTKDIAFILDSGNRITYANPAFTNMFDLRTGDSADELTVSNGMSLYNGLKAYAESDLLDLSRKIELIYRGSAKILESYVHTLSSGEIYVVATDNEEIDEMRQRLEYLKNRDVSSKLYNQNALEHFIRTNNGEGYRVVMARIDDFKHRVQSGGFNYAEEIASRVANAISEEFSMYNEFIFRSFEDEFVIFSRSPINHLHISQVNKRLHPDLKILWGISRRGSRFGEMLEEARYDLRDMETFSRSGSVFGINEEEDLIFIGKEK